MAASGPSFQLRNQWTFFPAPKPGGVKILTVHFQNSLIIDNGGFQMCFDLTAHTYNQDPSCGR